MFHDVDTPYKMSKYLSDKMSPVKPKEVFLGHRTDTTRKNGQMTQVLISDKSQIQSMYSWKLGNPLDKETLVSNAFPVMVGSLEHRQLLIEKLQSENEDIGMSSTIHVANAIRVFGQTYKTDCCPS
ncbi:hypothetical protein ATANTOWER_019764 [Ataeniobius toweri]|uniref:Uncharacterized protein n=1 Tax=Ataeniobius toweri TaxID=208326 RepID=A0ABU7AR19_9TELE|nr:hypothetical protein [Ataeniobius toweri]